MYHIDIMHLIQLIQLNGRCNYRLCPRCIIYEECHDNVLKADLPPQMSYEKRKQN